MTHHTSFYPPLKKGFLFRALSFLCLVVVAFCFSIQSASAQTAVVTPKLFKAQLPNSWFSLKFDSQPNETLEQFYPKGQNEARWGEMVLFQTFKSPLEPERLFKQIEKTMQSQCVNHSNFRALKTNSVGLVGALMCGENANKQGETTLLRAWRDQDTLYVVQKVWRTKSYEQIDQAGIYAAELSAWKEFLERTDKN